MNISLNTLVLFGAIAMLAACSDEESEAPALVGGSGGQAGHAVGGSTATGGDQADDCADALPLEPQTNSLGGLYCDHHGVLDPAGDRDSYRFSAEAGQWFSLTTKVNLDEGPNELNTVLTLRDETGSVQLAQSDDASLYGRPGSEIIHRFVEAGSYCVQVSEHADLVGSEPEGDPSFRYRLRVHPVDFDLYDDWNLDTEPNDELEDAQPLSVVPYSTHPFTRIVGQLGANDVDRSRFVAGPLVERVAVVFTPSGPAGHGASLGPGLVRLRHDDAEAAVIAELDYQTKPAEGYLVEAPNGVSFGIMATAEPGQGFLLEVEPPAGASPAADDFYAFIIETGWGAVYDPEPNDDRDNAVDVSQVGGEPGVTVHNFGGLLPAGDVDWCGSTFIGVGTTIELYCASWQLGSGLRDATFALFEADEPEPLQVQTETADTPVRWSDDPLMQPTMPAVGVTTVTPLPYLLRVTATQYDPDVESVYWACRMVTREP